MIAAEVARTRAGLAGMDATIATATPIRPADPTVDLARIAGLIALLAAQKG